MNTRNNDRAGVGEHIVTRCSRCNNDMNHTVVAQGADGIVARVKCMVCSSEHNYKRSVSKITGSQSRTTRVAKVNVPTGYKLWEEAKNGAVNKVPINYSMDQKFQKNNLICHPTLGEGVVMNAYDNKIDVIFRNDIKALVHNKK